MIKMGTTQEAKPLSRNKIRNMAKDFRKKLGIENDTYVDVIHLLDIDMPKHYKNFDYEILTEENMCVYGLATPDSNKIYIREDVYLRAENGVGRDRLTIIHEIFHFLFHTRQNIRMSENNFARNDNKPITYKDPEWQADAFAGEVLMDSEIIRDMSINEISRNCGVSFAAAKVQKNANKKIK